MECDWFSPIVGRDDRLGFLGLGMQSTRKRRRGAQSGSGSNKYAQVSDSKFSGTVTIDGQPPGIKVYDKHRILIMLYDPKNPPSPTHPILYVDCMPEPNDGSFEFSTYNRGDGVPPGSYIALFLDMQTSWGGGYKGTDRFKNRFNDPEKNDANAQFKVDLTDSGNADWQFNLVTEDNPPPAAPGPKTVFGPGK